MFTRSSKGQGIVGEAMVMAVVVMMDIILLFSLTGVGNLFEQQVTATISAELGEVRKRSVVTNTMNDYMWRAPGVKNDYGNRKVYRIVSYYFSTPGDAIYIDGRKIPRSEVKKDLKTYLKYKMERYWHQGPNKVDYHLEIRNVKGEKPADITVSTYEPTGTRSLISYPIALSNGQKATFSMWVKTSGSIFAVGGQ